MGGKGREAVTRIPEGREERKKVKGERGGKGVRCEGRSKGGEK